MTRAAGGPIEWRTLGSVRGVEPPLAGLDAWSWSVGGWFRRWGWRSRPLMREAEAVLGEADRLARVGGAEFERSLEEARGALARGRDAGEALRGAMAHAVLAAERSVGLRAYPVQVAGALAVTRGLVAEMATGEGKTLSAALGAGVCAMSGRGCHVLTANDYLALRDAEWMGELYALLGLRCGVVVSASDEGARRRAYGADVTYSTAREVAADFLRDQRNRGPGGVAGALLDGGGGAVLQVRGLHTAIVDEADAVLIDEAVTPLILSAAGGASASGGPRERAADEAAQSMREGKDYRAEESERTIELSGRGRERLGATRPSSITPRGWEELVRSALLAHRFYREGREYLVRDGRVVIIDDFTGRLTPDRTWRGGLHQAVEAKHGLDPTGAQDTVARVSFQRFFRLYERLGGMTGTAWEVRGELWSIYGLGVVRLPTHRPLRRRTLSPRGFGSAAARDDAVVEEAKGMRSGDRPVLIGTPSVEASERLAALLDREGVPHRVLNAVREPEEAEIIRGAGASGRVTIATNIAGRGTDIVLDDAAREAGGLHVIAAGAQASGRLDRQLFGRAGRQGDPGSSRLMISAEDETLRRSAPVLAWAARVAPVGRVAARVAQRIAVRRAERQRRRVMRQDSALDDLLSFRRGGF